MKSYIIHTDNTSNPEGEKVTIKSLEEYKEYLRREYAYSSCCLRVIEDLKIISEFQDKIGYHDIFGSKSCRECNRGNSWWQVTYVKYAKENLSSKERITAYINARFEHPDDRRVYDEMDKDSIARNLEQLQKNKSNKYFLETIAELIWNYNALDDLEFLEESD